MHELSLAVSLVEQVQEIAREQKAKKVLSISLEIGALSGIDRESFEFCFPMACEGTAVEGASLEIEEIPVRIICSDCGVESESELPALCCSSCKSRQFRIKSGREFVLNSIQVE